MEAITTRLIALFIVGLITWGCKSSNDDFDPFDRDFRFHNNINIANYDSIFDDIDYWALEEKNEGLNTFYVLYRPPFFLDDRIVGKGFRLEIDSFSMPTRDSLMNPDSPLYKKDLTDVVDEIFKKNPIDFDKIKSKLMDFKVAEVKMISDSPLPYEVEIRNFENQIFKARIDWNPHFTTSMAIREIIFVNYEDEQLSEAQ